MAPAFLHTRSSLTPPKHTRATLTPCSTSCCHAGSVTVIAQSGDGGEATLSVGLSASPSSCLGRNWTQGLCQVSNDFSSHPQIFGSPKNSIIAENCLPGNDSTEWDVNADGDPSIQVDCSLWHLFYLIVQGFATRFSVVKGEVVQFKIKTDSSNYRLDIFRVGWLIDLIKDF